MQDQAPRAGIGIEVSKALSSRIEIYHNTFYNIPNYAIRLGSDGQVDQAIVVNNIVKSAGKALKLRRGSINRLSTGANDYSPDVLEIDGTNINLTTWQGMGYDCNSFSTDPTFVADPANNDFYTAHGSIARDNAMLIPGYSSSYCEQGPDISFLESCEGFATVAPQSPK